MPNLRSTIKIVKQKVTCTLQMVGYSDIWTHMLLTSGYSKHVDALACDYVKKKQKERKVMN